jgi:UDP-N-acetylglucosamine 1-carboxyvinyltransferase
MGKILIRGGNRLSGNIEISGSKNASMPLLISTILLKGNSVFENVPNVSDLNNTVDLLKHLGCVINTTEKNGKKIININSEEINVFDAPREMVSRFRASFWVLGPLLAKYGRCRTSTPGGCSIGARPIDIYLDVLPRLGVKLKDEDGCVVAESIGKKLKGADITLRLPSVGVTHTLLMAGVLAEGKTIIRNAAREPEVVELGKFLIKAGAKIKGLGTNTIEIEGVKELTGQTHRISGDRIEAFSYIVSGLITDGDLTLKGAKFFEILDTPINTLLKMGAKITKINDNSIRIIGNKKSMKGADITTDFYPGFPTDCQPIIMPLLASIKAKSSINETIYEDRFRNVSELIKMGATIKLDKNNTAWVDGVENSLQGAVVLANDLRAGMSLVLAGLAAKGETIIENIQHIERGYENLVEKLKVAGGNIATF